MKWTKAEMLANLHLIKIHFLIIKIIIVKGISSWLWKIFH